MLSRGPSPQGDQPYGDNPGIPTPKKIKRMTSTNELLWIRGALESKLFRRWDRERGMFRDNHLDAGYAAHRLFTEKFGDPTLKPYRPFISGIFQAYPTTPSEELKTQAAICRRPTATQGAAVRTPGRQTHDPKLARQRHRRFPVNGQTHRPQLGQPSRRTRSLHRHTRRGPVLYSEINLPGIAALSHHRGPRSRPA